MSLAKQHPGEKHVVEQAQPENSHTVDMSIDQACSFARHDVHPILGTSQQLHDQADASVQPNNMGCAIVAMADAGAYGGSSGSATPSSGNSSCKDVALAEVLQGDEDINMDPPELPPLDDLLHSAAADLDCLKGDGVLCVLERTAAASKTSASEVCATLAGCSEMLQGSDGGFTRHERAR